ncbi:hypothetical protein H6F98_30920 [Microcoleus sp. FACHB-SPT15]|nr:hypothetical protein [Microcoleus sp. FACHB-SPT15]
MATESTNDSLQLVWVLRLFLQKASAKRRSPYLPIGLRKSDRIRKDIGQFPSQFSCVLPVSPTNA